MKISLLQFICHQCKIKLNYSNVRFILNRLSLFKMRWRQIGIVLLILIWLTWLHINNSHDSITIKNNLITSPFIELANKQIPLPQRIWTMAGNLIEDKTLPNGSNTIASQLLFGIDKKAVTAFVLIHTNTIPSPKGWGISYDCKNSKNSFTAVFEHKDLNFKCAFVGEIHTKPQAIVWNMAKTLIKQHKLHIPQHWIIVGVRIADRLNIVDVRYGFDPQALANLPVQPQLKLALNKQENSYTAVIQELIKWQEIATYWVERGFRRQLDRELPLSLPTLIINKSASSLIAESRLQQLNQLYTTGWLSNNELAQQRKSIQTSVITQSDVTVDIWSLGALKTAGHTTQSLFWMWGVNYLFLGNAYVAGGLALAKSFISPIRYYLQETAWNTWGPRRNPTLPIIDFMPNTNY